MIRKIAVSMLFTILVSCAASEPEVSTQVTVLESPQPTAIQRADIGDGGFTDWIQQLLTNRKGRLLISGMGSERFVSLFG
jgi:hypothetical protein